MLQLIQGEEEIVLVNHTTGEAYDFTIRDLTNIEEVKELQATAEEGEFELEYLQGCLGGEACNYFLELCDLADLHQKPLAVIGKIFNACDGLDELSLILENDDYAIIRAKTPALAFRDYVVKSGELDSTPFYIHDYIDYDKWLNSSSVQVAQTDASRDQFDCAEFVVYHLV